MPIAGEEVRLRIAQIVPSTEAEGPGRRFALWFQGCSLRCPGCCNPEMLPFTGGDERTVVTPTTWPSQSPFIKPSNPWLVFSQSVRSAAFWCIRTPFHDENDAIMDAAPACTAAV